jgi:hypothetical protein
MDTILKWFVEDWTWWELKKMLAVSAQLEFNHQRGNAKPFG